jgi:hypothetical protein
MTKKDHAIFGPASSVEGKDGEQKMHFENGHKAESRKEKVPVIARRDLIKASATIAAMVPVVAATSVAAQQSQTVQQPVAETAAQSTTLAEISLSPIMINCERCLTFCMIIIMLFRMVCVIYEPVRKPAHAVA